MNKKGFSLVEVVFVVTIFLLAIAGALQAFVELNKDFKVIWGYLGAHLKGREVIDIIARDCRMAARVMDEYGGDTTGDDCLVLKVPSVDASGNVIDVNNEFDYIVYRISGADLRKVVAPGPLSARAAYNGIMKKDIDSMFLSSNGTALSAITYKSTIKEITIRVSLSEIIVERSISMSPETTVKLMNYEWEYVR